MNIIKVVIRVPEDVTDQQELDFYLKSLGVEKLDAKIDHFLYRKSDWPKPV